MVEHAYTVSGMNCGHCAQSVTEAGFGSEGVADLVSSSSAGTSRRLVHSSPIQVGLSTEDHWVRRAV
ncbi:cation-transporting ATPase [Amycolatopsis sp. lyj-109]|uniref:cation-transporting ATPase n=1 Tax=Amycolatopsis sp. lyj-109 TaxID=2789287 RepID=UPI00397800A9